MPSSLKKYCTDVEKFRNVRNVQRQKNYSKTAIYGHCKWTKVQDEMVLKHDITDTELSRIIGHSVQAIQMRRYRLKKRQK